MGRGKDKFKDCSKQYQEEGSWQTIFSGQPSNLERHKFSLFSPEICETTRNTRRLRILFDTCRVSGWNQIAGIRLIGEVEMRYTKKHGVGLTTGRTGIVSDLGGRIIYEPNKDVHTEDSFEYAVVVCPPRGFLSEPTVVTIQVASVSDSPVGIPFTVNATENDGNHFVLIAKDVDKVEENLVYIVTSLPTSGALYLADFDESLTRGEEYVSRLVYF